MFIGEQESGSITEFESRDVTFLEDEFPKKGEIGEDCSLFETLDQDNDISGVHPSGSNMRSDELNSTHSQLQPSEVTISSLPNPSGSIMGNDVQSVQSPIRRTSRQSIPRRRFDIEGETFMVAPQDEDEPRNINEALNCPSKEKWIHAMEEEIESMK